MAGHAKQHHTNRSGMTAGTRRQRASSAEVRSSERPVAPSLRATKNSLPGDVRIEVVPLLNQRLAECIDLHTQCKQAHWNVRGPSFIGLHELFDKIDDAVRDYVDLIAERIVQLGGVAEGTVRVVTARTTLADYPLNLSTSAEHVSVLCEALASFGRAARIGIQEMVALEDDDSADILTEVSRGIDKWLWFVESHQAEEATVGMRR